MKKNQVKKRWVISILIIIFMICSNSARAQEEVDFQTWSDITFTYYFTPKLSTGGDVGLRGIISAENWNQFYIRPNVRYRFSPWFNLTGGVGTFNTFELEFANTYEFRFFQDANFRWPDLGFVETFHRVRFEQRFFWYSEDFPNDFSSRGRYLIGFESIDFGLFIPRPKFYLKAMFELFVPLGEGSVERFVNQNRLHGGIGYRANRSWRVELQYFRQSSRNKSDDGFKTGQNILRLRLFWNINFIDPIRAEDTDHGPHDL